MSNLNQLINMYDALFDYMMSNSGCGASDTEPRAILFNTLEKAIYSKDYKLPRGARGWELFSDDLTSEEIANTLTYRLKKIIELIEKSTKEEKDNFVSYLKGS